MKNEKPTIRFAFFGTPHLAAVFLSELEGAGLLPALVVTTPDRKKGRGLDVQPPEVKTWALERSIPVLQFETLNAAALDSIRTYGEFDIFVVIYYGKILPAEALAIPHKGTLNVHFSLLPRWRGQSPVRSAIANDDREIGTSIVLMDEIIDHGPIIAQKKLPLASWPPRARDAELLATHESARLFSEILPSYVAGDIEASQQNHDVATQCPKYEKADGKLDIRGDAYQNLLKIRAFDTTVGTHAFFERPTTGAGQVAPKQIRVQILEAHMENAKLVIDTVKPEGKREMTYEEFLRSGARPV